MKVLILRKCKEDGTSNHGEFRYPKSGYVEAPDWDSQPECGGGLHGLLWGHGTFDLEGFGSLFQVIEADSENVIEFDGKYKFKCGTVLLTGTQLEAITLLKAHPNYPKDNLLNYDILTGGDYSVLTGGFRSTLTGGDHSVLTGGDHSVLTGGFRSTLAGRDHSVLTGGDYSVLTGGDYSVLTGGFRSTLTGGFGSILRGGDYSAFTGRFRSALKGGDKSVFIVYWHKKDLLQVSVKKITKATANKKYKFEDGKFNLVPDQGG